MNIRLLRGEDDRTGFRSGDVDLDRFFLRYAGQNQFRHHIGSTYVALHEGRIVGFATVAPSVITAAALPTSKKKKLPQYPLPVLRLARLAVDEASRGAGVGSDLLRFVLILVQRLASDYGCVGLVVDAKASSVGFYGKLGFVALELVAGELGDRPLPQAMFVELGAIPDPGRGGYTQDDR